MSALDELSEATFVTFESVHYNLNKQNDIYYMKMKNI